MFIGHFGVALAARPAAPRASLGTLFFAAEFLDLVWPILLLTGREHVRIAPGLPISPLDFYDYPTSHSLLAVLGWSLLVGAIYFAVRRYRRETWILGWLVLSHWLLDFLVHRPDLPLWPRGPRVGLALWNSVPESVAVELLIFAAGLGLYLAHTRSQDRIGVVAFWSLMGLLFFGWISALFAGPPPSVKALAWGGMTMWLSVPWGTWADYHRKLTA